MSKQTSFSFKLSKEQQDRLAEILAEGTLRPREVPHTRAAAIGPDFNVALYQSGACVVQGQGAQEWVTFTLEPLVLLEARIGYEDVVDPERSTPHMGVDESGKGDFFGPLVIAAAYVDERIVPRLDQLKVRDSKRITSDKVAEKMADQLVDALEGRFAIVTIGPRAYNKLYAKMQNVNRMLAWGHARCIEDLLAKVPDCPRALSDQFGPKAQIERALLGKGRKIKLDQRPKAESDPAVAAASILARAGFLRGLRKLQEQFGVPILKGASAAVREAAVQLVRQRGPESLLDAVKCHFKTADQVLAAAGHARAALGPDGQAISRARREEGEPR